MVSQATLKKQTHALVTKFVNNYVDKYGRAPAKFNRYRDQWGFQGMIEDLGYERAEAVVDYYFRTGRVGHPVQHLMYNYDNLNNIMLEMEEDAEKRLLLRKETEERVKAWKERYGNK